MAAAQLMDINCVSRENEANSEVTALPRVIRTASEDMPTSLLLSANRCNPPTAVSIDSQDSTASYQMWSILDRPQSLPSPYSISTMTLSSRGREGGRLACARLCRGGMEEHATGRGRNPRPGSCSECARRASQRGVRQRWPAGCVADCGPSTAPKARTQCRRRSRGWPVRHGAGGVLGIRAPWKRHVQDLTPLQPAGVHVAVAVT